jgi:hypothetical protein
MVYAENKAEYIPIDEATDDDKVLNISGTELRHRLQEGLEIPDWFSFPEVVAELRRTHPARHKQGFFTGLSGSGKSTIANALMAKLMEIGGRPISLLDGDIVRKNLSSELGFSKEHRDLNIQRIGYVASEITKNGGIAICAPIAPYARTRRIVRDMIEPVGGFVGNAIARDSMRWPGPARSRSSPVSAILMKILKIPRWTWIQSASRPTSPHIAFWSSWRAWVLSSRKAMKLYIKTMGCQMNEYDSEKMADVLRESHGYELTSSPDDADLLLMNTCSIREKAQEKVFSELGRWRQLKDKNPDVKIGVGGCVASQEGEGITRRAPFVDVVFGPQTLHRLPAMIADAGAKSVIDVSFPEIEKFDRLPEPRAEGPTAFVSVMEGCSKYCSFCVVPYTRGEEISRPFDRCTTVRSPISQRLFTTSPRLRASSAFALRRRTRSSSPTA